MKRWCTEHFYGALAIWATVGGGIMLAWEVYFLFSDRDVPVVPLLLFFTLWTLLGWWMLNRWVVLRNRQVVDALKNKCDPEPLLDWTIFSLNYWGKRRVNYHFIAACRLNLSTALNALGRLEEAERTCLEIAPDKLARLPIRTRLSYWCYLCTAALNLGKLEEAQSAREEALRIFGGTDFPAKLKPDFSVGLETMECVLLFKQGRFDGLEERFSVQLENADCLYSRVTAHSFLAHLALARGDENTAAEHLRFVAEHGNKLAIRAKAEAMLESL